MNKNSKAGADDEVESGVDIRFKTLVLTLKEGKTSEDFIKAFDRFLDRWAHPSSVHHEWVEDGL